MKRKRTLLMTIALLAAVPASSILAAGESFTDDAVVITESPAEEAFSDSTAEAVSPTDEITDILSSSDSAEETDIPDASLSDEKAETTDTAFPIEISSACFPDELFQDYILEKIDSDCDGILSADEAESVTEIDIHGMGIGSLEGIACFPELQQLFCSENNLADLDVSQNLALTTLNCADNLLTSLDLSRNTELTALYCTGNALETLDVTLNTKLSILECDETVTVLRADQTLSAPILTAAVNAPTGVKITWEEVPGAEKYRVFRKVPGGSWKRTGDTTEVSYTDTSAVSGTTYIYTVRCVSSDGASYTSSFDSSGLSVYYLSAPILSSVSNTANGVKITWEAVTGAEKYRVFRKASGDSAWTGVKTTSSTSCTDASVQSGTVYTYTVRCTDSAGTAFTSSFDSTGKSILYLSAPVLTGVSNTTSGVKITWEAVTGAEKYRVFRKASGSSSWKTIAVASSASYTDTSVKSGTTYTYTVRCTDASGTSHTSGYDKTGKTIRYLCAPVLSGVSNTVSGVKITWKAVTGAEKYRVYRKASGDSSWTRVKTTSSVSYTDTSVKSGTTYTYTVRCVNSTGTAFTSSFDSTGKTILYLSAPVLTSVTNTTSGIKIKWSSVTGAVNYRVFRKTSASSTWKGIANTTSTSYTDTSAKSGTTYLYTVRCINSDGTSYTSSYDSSGLSIRYLSAPVLSSVSNTTSGVSITWKAVTGAEKYRVYRKASGASSWTRVKTTSSTSCTDTSVKTGTTYTYTVRCVNSAGTAFTSSFDSTGKSILYVAAPALSSISGSSTGSITVKWTTVSAVTGYQIRYSTSSGFSSYSTVTLSGASSSSKTISGLTAGSIYYVRIRSYITVSGKNYYSGWSATKTSDPEEALSGLKTTISSMTQSYGGTWSVYIKNLETGDILNLNEQSMYPASVIKAFVMASVYNEINEGRLTETSTISSLLNSMITISDNESYNELVRVQSSSGSSFLSGAAVVNAYLSANGYTNTCVHHTLHPAYSSLVSDGGSNISSAKDCGVLLERIYNGTCVSKTYSQKMLNLLLAQQRRTKIPAGVPSGIQVANKTGETSTTENDIAIVFGEKTDYVICVFSSGSSYGATGIKNISKTVYEYLN